MKHFLIRYRLASGSVEAWGDQIGRFIAALENDPELKGKITYRALKQRDGAVYFHLASALDGEAVAALGRREFFQRYTELMKAAAGGEVEVVPLELVSETAPLR